MKLRTKRLTICPLGLAHLQSTHEYASDAENTRYMVYLPNETVEDTAEFLARAEEEWAKEEPKFYECAILYEGKHIGAISLYPDENRLLWGAQEQILGGRAIGTVIRNPRELRWRIG